jgi:hypothetical protein
MVDPCRSGPLELKGEEVMAEHWEATIIATDALDLGVAQQSKLPR